MITLSTFLKICLAVLLGTVLGYIVGNSVFTAKATNNVTICHKTGNGWQKISVDDDAVNGFGNGDHNSSSHQSGQDIIPPGYWDANGRNWDATGQGIWNNNCNVPTPTPTAVPTVTPTVVPTVTPTNTPTPTPFEECVRCEEPTPTPEPTSAPQPLTEPGPGSAPSCSDPRPAVLPVKFHIVRNGSTAEAYWQPGDANTADILYRENHVKDWVHSLTLVNTGRATINHLVPSESYTFALRERNACSDGTIITPVVVDPPAYGRLFQTTYWLVW